MAKVKSLRQTAKIRLGRLDPYFVRMTNPKSGWTRPEDEMSDIPPEDEVAQSTAGQGPKVKSVFAGRVKANPGQMRHTDYNKAF